MGDGNLYEKIQDMLGHRPGSFSVLEEQVDIDLQMEYFECSRLAKEDLNEKEVIGRKMDLSDLRLPESERKELFVRLASIESVEAYRTIEQYLKEGNENLKDWAILALQESRMLLESKLLDEHQIFISTGLGGRGMKLRYFAVVLARSGKDIKELQQRIIKNEFELMLRKHDAEIEKIQFFDQYTSILALIPLNVSIKDIFRAAIDECNQYGKFLKSNFILTNVKELNETEITDFIRKQEQTKP